MALTGAHAPGATPLSEEDIVGLKPTNITTQGELNEAEAENIIRGQEWALRSRTAKLPEMLCDDYLLRLHQGDVWGCMEMGRESPGARYKHRRTRTSYQDGPPATLRRSSWLAGVSSLSTRRNLYPAPLSNSHYSCLPEWQRKARSHARAHGNGPAFWYEASTMGWKPFA